MSGCSRTPSEGSRLTADDWHAGFRSAPDVGRYLRENSHLPGPRANLELLGAAAEEVDEEWARSWAARLAGDDPTDVFVIAVALVALGRFAAADSVGVLDLMRTRAADPPSASSSSGGSSTRSSSAFRASAWRRAGWFGRAARD